MIEVTLVLNQFEAEKWKKFQERYDIFEALEKNNAFNIGWGKVTTNFARGELQNVIKEEVIYKKD